MAPEKEEVFESLVDTYLNNLGQYVAKPSFPGKFILKAYKDKNNSNKMDKCLKDNFLSKKQENHL